MKCERFSLELHQAEPCFYELLDSGESCHTTFGKWITFDDGSTGSFFVDLLNQLYDENQELKFMLQNVSEQRDEFHRGARENARRVGELKKRVLELEKEVKALSDGEADWISEEYL